MYTMTFLNSEINAAFLFNIAFKSKDILQADIGVRLGSIAATMFVSTLRDGCYMGAACLNFSYRGHKN